MDRLDYRIVGRSRSQPLAYNPRVPLQLNAGARLGGYEVTGPVGAGGMGQVYRARDVRLGRDVALKTLPPTFAQDPERVARFTREAQVLAALNHPHIAAIHGLEEAEGGRVPGK